MHRPVSPKNGPPGVAKPPVNLRKPLAAVEGLIALARGMAKARIDFVETHKIEIVGSGKEEFASGPRDAVHLGDGSLHPGQVLDSLAGNHHVEAPIGKGQVLGVSLNERGKRRVVWQEDFAAGGMQCCRRKIAPPSRVHRH